MTIVAPQWSNYETNCLTKQNFSDDGPRIGELLFKLIYWWWPFFILYRGETDIEWHREKSLWQICVVLSGCHAESFGDYKSKAYSTVYGRLLDTLSSLWKISLPTKSKYKIVKKNLVFGDSSWQVDSGLIKLKNIKMNWQTNN